AVVSRNMALSAPIRGRESFADINNLYIFSGCGAWFCHLFNGLRISRKRFVAVATICDKIVNESVNSFDERSIWRRIKQVAALPYLIFNPVDEGAHPRLVNQILMQRQPKAALQAFVRPDRVQIGMIGGQKTGQNPDARTRCN